VRQDLYKISAVFMNEKRVKYLLERYAENKASKEEVEEMFQLIQFAQSDKVLRDLIVETRNEDLEANVSQEDWKRIWNNIREARAQGGKGLFSLTPVRVAAAVLFFFIISGSIYLFFGKKNIQNTVAVTNKIKEYKNDIAPGGNKAVLTLADGSTIILDSLHNGLLAQQGNTQILKVDAGALAYNSKYSNAKNKTEVEYNVLTTPRGGEYQITLPDGTKVWLNAASSLRFPTSFTDKQRVVELTGEAYFEVVKNASMPFHVKVNNIDVEDLGTHFNIMAYENEQGIKTTLLEGKVSVTKNGVTKNLVPGKQAITNDQTQTIDVTNANVEQAVAWKDGYFRFKETNIHELMREVERWYDVDVEFKTQGHDQDYTGIVPRTQNVSGLLHTLELTGTVHFEIEGRKIIVLP
jgi:transmembrane sensor